MKTKLLITINHLGRIPPVYQDGPIIHPIWIDVKTAYTLISCHYKVYEHNPKNLSDKVLLTLENVTKDNFPPYIPVTHEKHDAGTPIEITNSVELPEPDRIKEISEIETPATEHTKEEEKIHEEVNEEKSATHTFSSMSLNERAASLGIDTTGMSRNKIRAAIKEKESQKVN